MAAAVGVGAILLAGAYVLGTINRWREGGGGWRCTRRRESWVPRSSWDSDLAFGAYDQSGWLIALGGLIWLIGFALAFVGLWSAAGGGGAGVAQAAVELFDTTIRVGSNLISFVRLAAFGLTHAALGAVIWEGTVALWSLGGAGSFVAVLLFTAGNVLAFVLEALVAGCRRCGWSTYELFLACSRARAGTFWTRRTSRPLRCRPRDSRRDHDRLAGSSTHAGRCGCGGAGPASWTAFCPASCHRGQHGSLPGRGRGGRRCADGVARRGWCHRASPGCAGSSCSIQLGGVARCCDRRSRLVPGSGDRRCPPAQRRWRQ